VTTLFRAALGDAAFARLPPAVRQLHEPGAGMRFAGEAEVEGPEGPIARCVAALIGFPAAGQSIPVAVDIRATPRGERWTRDFAGRRFTSHLRLAGTPPRLVERFGPLSFTLDLPMEGGALGLRVASWRALGLPMPRALAPLGDATESEDAQGRFRFDVALHLPFGMGRIVRYRGWLLPDRG
jgi:hypothetical protein